MSGKQVKRWARSEFIGIAHYAICPFCPDRRKQALNKAMPWCAKCGCEYRITSRGATFDQSLKTERFAWGKAVNLAGGVKLAERKP